MLLKIVKLTCLKVNTGTSAAGVIGAHANSAKWYLLFIVRRTTPSTSFP